MGTQHSLPPNPSNKSKTQQALSQWACPAQAMGAHSAVQLTREALSSKHLLWAHTLSPPQQHWEQEDYQEVIKAGGVPEVTHGTLRYTYPSEILLMGSRAGGVAGQAYACENPTGHSYLG